MLNTKLTNHLRVKKIMVDEVVYLEDSDMPRSDKRFYCSTMEDGSSLSMDLLTQLPEIEQKYSQNKLSK